MAIFSASLRTLSRTRGDSAVAAAAYRAGLVLSDERLGIVHDYSRRAGVEQVHVLAPKGSPSWAGDPSRLWNAAEAAEVRRNARVARELIVALPHEVDAPGRARLSLEIAQVMVDRYGVAAMVAIHAPDAAGDARNHHAHILFSARSLDAHGFGAKVRVLDDRRQGPKEVDALRQTVADFTNAALEAAGEEVRVDHRTLAAQSRTAEARGDYEVAARLTREPTTHVGRAGFAIARKGGPDMRIAHNIERIEANRAALMAHIRGRAGQVSPRLGKSPTGGARRGLRATGSLGTTVLGGPTRGARATGRDADLLNAQAALWEEGVRAERKTSQAYLDGLRRSAEQSAPLVDAYLASIGRPSDRARLLEQCDRDPGWVERLRRSLEARAELLALSDELPRRRQRYGQAMVATVEAERVLRALEAARPPTWQPFARRQWAQKRRAERARLMKVRDAEAAARSLASGEGARKLNDRARGLREEIRRTERERRASRAPAPAKNADHQGARAEATLSRRSPTSSSRPTP